MGAHLPPETAHPLYQVSPLSSSSELHLYSSKAKSSSPTSRDSSKILPAFSSLADPLVKPNRGTPDQLKRLRKLGDFGELAEATAEGL